MVSSAASLLAREPVTADRSALARSDPLHSGVHASGILIRPLASAADYRACVALQREIWGTTFDPVPASILQVALHLGGIALGAFDVHGALVGFVFGLTGIDEAAKTIHWSHMLAVRAHLRDAGLGRRLKECQRQELHRRGIGEMQWTYDPLIAKNAHINLNVLGASVVRYVPDMYGDTGSPLHHGLATDRLVVACDTSRPAHAVASTLDVADLSTPILTVRPRADDPLPRAGTTPPRLRLEIPSDFGQLLQDDPAEARAWHAATRTHFQWALGGGYSVTGLRRDVAGGRSFYILEWARR
jgi:predicted GNAT superfamily acetyltransferase